MDTELFSEWQSQSLAFLVNLLGDSHVYSGEFKAKVKDPIPSETKKGIGVLQAVLEDIEGGYLFK